MEIKPLTFIMNLTFRLLKKTWLCITRIGKYHLVVMVFKVLSHSYRFNSVSFQSLCFDEKLHITNRSLKLWMVLRLYGLENLQCYIRNHINLAKYFEDLVGQDPRFEITTPRIFSLVFFRLLPSSKDEALAEKLNHEFLNAVNSIGKTFISHTVLSGKYLLRFAVGAPLTEERHVNGAWNVLQEKASALLGTLSWIELARSIAKLINLIINCKRLVVKRHQAEDSLAMYLSQTIFIPLRSDKQNRK
ncbi:tryptophan decarboxylase 2-like [Humulus lupulus]|uniref:tryptophan decarboxylase 2-like n=1 Tax=Humulus lupulus TaxID=3486 RepID=UPI002B41722D|nr:tryptophan decarboxylase 2-like [Humulus lupulus]